MDGSSTPSSSSSKRRHNSAAAASFKAPPPPLKPSPTETLFRILCPADKTGGVIGKGGSIIRQFREETGAKIRIEDPVPGSDDRVILIVADSQPKKWTDYGEGEDDVSPAQRALVRVFERILRVEEGEEKEIHGAVVCRLLALGSQVGCVLGKGGKIVEKIRQESGAQIRVFGKDQVPVCAASGDDLIHITGSFSAVRKAVLSVSSCLQDNPRTEQTNFGASKPFGTTILHGTGLPSPVEPYAQRGFSLSLHTSDYHSRVYSSNPGIDIVASAHRKVVEEEVVFRMLCSNDKVGSIIGKAGVIIRALQSETGALIKIIDMVADSDERVIVISARENSESKHSPAQDAVLRVHSRLSEAGVEKGAVVSARLLVPSQQIGCLLGKGGAIIAEMRRATGASIRIFLKEQVPKCAQPNEEVVQVTGSFQSIQDALFHITSRIRETIFPLKPYPSSGMAQYMTAPPEISPTLLRSRNEPTSPGRYSTMGLSHGHNHHIGFSHTTDRQPPPSHSMGSFGPVDRVPFSYSSESTGLHPAFDHPPPSPRSWAPQAVSSGNPRGIPELGTGLGFRSGVVGSGSQTGVATSTTVEVVVPKQLLGFIYGENGGNLTEIREISGAKATIHDPKPGATEGVVFITGTPDQKHAAQSLLHAFILCGQTSS